MGSLENFAKKMSGSQETAAAEKTEDEPVAETAEGKEGLHELTDDNFSKHTSTGFHFIMFFAPWCGHCKRLEPVWLDLAKQYQSSEQNPNNVKIGRVRNVICIIC